MPSRGEQDRPPLLPAPTQAHSRSPTCPGFDALTAQIAPGWHRGPWLRPGVLAPGHPRTTGSWLTARFADPRPALPPGAPRLPETRELSLTSPWTWQLEAAGNVSQGQVPRVLRNRAKIITATKTAAPQTSSSLSHGGGVWGCPVRPCRFVAWGILWAALLTAPAGSRL